MKKGDKKRLAEFTGLDPITVRRYLQENQVTFKTHLKMQSALRKLNINSSAKPNYKKVLADRQDIYNNLPRGAEKEIANRLNISRHMVWRILHGKRRDDFCVIEKAELIAAINIWQNRFCKYKSQLNIEEILNL